MSTTTPVPPSTPTPTLGRTGTTTAATVNVPVLHIDALFPAPTAEVANILHGVSMESQLTTVNAFFYFLDGTLSSLLHLNEGNQVHMALLNIPKTQLVKVVFCTGMGSSPIKTTTLVDGRLLLLHGGGNVELVLPWNVRLSQEHFLLGSGQVATDKEIRSRFQVS